LPWRRKREPPIGPEGGATSGPAEERAMTFGDLGVGMEAGGAPVAAEGKEGALPAGATVNGCYGVTVVSTEKWTVSLTRPRPS
jgi:hypothetical protein